MSMDARIDEAERKIIAGEIAEGQALLDDLAVDFPNQPRVLNNLGTVAHRQGQLEMAIQYFLKAVSADPKNPTSLLNLVEILESIGEFGEALERCESYLDFDAPDSELQEAKVRLKLKVVSQTKSIHSETSTPVRLSRGGHGFLPQKFLVTAVVSTYNSDFYFSGCLQNLIEQTLFREGLMEIIIVDSGSQQEERSTAKKFQDTFPNIVYIRTERESLYAAWNRIVLSSRAKYLVNANTDDRHHPDAFEIMAEALDKSSVALVYSDALMTPTPNEPFVGNSSQIAWSLPDYNHRQALADCPYGCLVMWRRNVHHEIGLFDETLRIAGDYDFFLKASLFGSALHIPVDLCLYFESMKNLSYAEPEKVNLEIEKFLPKFRMQTPLDTIYPFLKTDSNEKALGMAAFDFGTLLANPNSRQGFSESVYFYEMAQKKLGSLPEISNNLAYVLGKMGQTKEAGRLLQAALIQFPILTQHVNLLGPLPEAKALFTLDFPPIMAMPKLKFGSSQKMRISEYRSQQKKWATVA